jgi:hypothetical protein
VEFRDLLAVDGVVEFLENIQDSDPIFRGLMKGENQTIYNYRYDAYRFCRKVFSITDAYWQNKNADNPDRYMAWIDADTVFTAEVPRDFLVTQLGEDEFLAFLDRPHAYTEAGWMVFDTQHDYAFDFFYMYASVYTTGAFRYLGEWHDCYVLDFVRVLSRVKCHRLTKGFSDEQMGHPFIHAEIGQYADHLKGPDRKKMGHSPERKV